MGENYNRFASFAIAGNSRSNERQPAFAATSADRASDGACRPRQPDRSGVQRADDRRIGTAQAQEAPPLAARPDHAAGSRARSAGTRMSAPARPLRRARAVPPGGTERSERVQQ